ncbi:DET1-like protein, partial [Leptotrombidium deliense]
LHSCRNFYQNVFPNLTVVNIDKPPCFLRKFTPDGKYLIAFSCDQTSIEIYEFQGPAAAEHLLQGIRFLEEYTKDGLVPEQQLTQIRSKIFESFFKLKHVVNVALNGEQLNRECSLFTDDSRLLVVGSAAYVSEESHPHYFDVYRNNESMSLSARSLLEDYSLHLIDIRNGTLCDKRTFKTDKIYLSHNQGIYLYKNTLAVLSVQHQTIHIFHIEYDILYEGKFVDVKKIGRFCYEDDEFLISSVQLMDMSGNRQPNPIRPFREATINSLKHRLLVHLYLKAGRESASSSNSLPLRRFFQNFDQYCNLRMWKMQLLDEHHLLIKYASEESISFRISDINSPPSFFVLYNMLTTQVIAIFENTSEELLYLFENFCDHFRNSSINNSNIICSPSNNVFARLNQERFKQTITNAKNGGRVEAIRRLLAQLPISAQSYTSSPYLDLSLFSYDDKWVSALERPKNCGDHPIKFYARAPPFLRFKIYAGIQGRTAPTIAKRLVAFTFHPFDPFAISVQRTNNDYVVNFHIRHQN